MLLNFFIFCWTNLISYHILGQPFVYLPKNAPHMRGVFYVLKQNFYLEAEICGIASAEPISSSQEPTVIELFVFFIR